MPYVELNTNVKVENKEELCRKITEKITVMATKKPERTMVRIADEQFMYFDLNTDGCIRVKIDLFRESALEDKQAYTVEISRIIAEELNIPTERIYLSFAEYPNWGNKGILR